MGWGEAGGHWDESALGCFGESVTYDPDVTLGRAMIDDVRPFLVQSDAQWGWTGNVGGADFLRYRTAAEPYWERRLARVRSQYEASGPNRTDVRCSGLTLRALRRGGPLRCSCCKRRGPALRSARPGPGGDPLDRSLRSLLWPWPPRVRGGEAGIRRC